MAPESAAGGAVVAVVGGGATVVGAEVVVGAGFVVGEAALDDGVVVSGVSVAELAAGVCGAAG